MALWNSKLILFYILNLFSTAFQVNARYWFRAQAPGVAFGLTPDYGIAAIHLKDGTTVPIARIQGPPEYQAFMRNKTTLTTHESKSSTLCNWLSPALDVLPSALGLDFNICRHPDVNSVKSMLGTLKIAVESYLGTNFCYAALSFDHVRGDYTEIVSEEALQALGVSRVLGFPQAASCEIYSREPREDPDSDIPGYKFPEPRTILAIDYSLHWFNVGMYILEEGVLERVDDTGGDPKIEKDNQLQALKESLEHLFAEPPPDFPLPKDIDQLLVYGDDSQNGALHHLLENFLGADLVRNANISTSVFDGVGFAAEAAYDVMDDIYFENRNPPRFGCMWRSKLYRNPGHSEL